MITSNNKKFQKKLEKTLKKAVQESNFQKIITELGPILTQTPKWAEGYALLGMALHKSGAVRDACSAYQRALELQSDNLEWQIIWLQCRLEARQNEIDALEKLLALFSLHAHDDALSLKISDALIRSKASKIVAAAMKWRYNKYPCSDLFCALLAMELIKAGDITTGCTIYGDLISRSSDNLVYSLPLCCSLMNIGAFQACVDIVEATIKAKPALRPCLLNEYGNALTALNRSREAQPIFEEFFRNFPKNYNSHFNYALSLLKDGKYREGWKYAEYMPEEFRPPERHPWRGKSSISGKTLLITHEQGLGDTLMFLRYVPFVEKTGAHIVLALPPPLMRLGQSVSPHVTIVEHGTNNIKYDVSCPFPSLPLALDDQLGNNIPARVPYLYPCREHIERMAQFIPNTGAIRVGIVWAGEARPRFGLHYRNRSATLKSFAPILQLEGIDFINLQFGKSREELATWEGCTIHDPMKHVSDMEDTAALIANLDLVISVDTSVAHLAGAIGKPVWMITRSDCDWRWMEKREDSPWYPTMRIFRSTPGPLDHAIGVVAEELHKQISNSSLLSSDNSLSTTQVQA
ncbi:tetratricopeptide repeat protein [Acetobacter estunensis]|uniref:tetratricopeptide repeat protein n=1 Tax=Acetobacter estunensis TaxID=104097 RepID=UPI001C2CD894|nr:tetratricopeptide repeat protein [Acetobacter estunensis]MBV1837665.1 tetratricopeptide repeat-containing glycosyltransferase family protein [Acetobacter estunensis]